VLNGPDAEPDFDLSAAGLRADGSELRISLEVLAGKLEETLPGHTRVQRRGSGLWRKSQQQVRGLEVDLGGSTYQLDVEPDRVQCSRERRVGGIAIKHESLDPAAWVSALTQELRTEAQRSSDARRALEGLLG
jgi:hypothetical protein